MEEIESKKHGADSEEGWRYGNRHPGSLKRDAKWIHLPQPPSNAGGLTMLARRFRKHYEDELVGLYATQKDPYEPELGTSDIGTHVVVVIQGPYEHWTETDAVTEITHDVLNETDWVAPVTSHHVSHDSAVAKRLKEKGVRFD